MYVWGYNGYCRLGLGNQVDVLKPKPVPQVYLLTTYLTSITLKSIIASSPVKANQHLLLRLLLVPRTLSWWINKVYTIWQAKCVTISPIFSVPIANLFEFISGKTVEKVSKI